MMVDNVVEISGLCRSYQEADRIHPVIEQAELQIGSAEVVALLGRSGSGKSTLLNLIAGIDRPDSGQILVVGERVSSLKEPELTRFRRRRIGFVYQFFNLIPTLTTLENIALPLELNAYPGSEINVLAKRMLDAVGLVERTDAFPDQLSGGEQQRVAIARALVHRPSLVLADEPTGNLDQVAGEQVLDLMLSLVRDEQSSLLLVTHSLSVAQRADRILTLHKGQFHDHGIDLAW